MSIARRSLAVFALALLTLTQQQARAEDEVPKIKPAAAKDHLGKEVVVEFKVESGYFKDGTKPCFLNSKANHRDKDNFIVVIFPKTLMNFKDAKIEDPALHFAGKVISVKGKIEVHLEKMQIVVKSVGQITVVEEKDKEKESK